MLTVHQDNIVVEEKGIYSVENFLTARRLMYWQVYLHKTSVGAERMLVNIIKRAKYLATSGEKIICSEPLKFFLMGNYTLDYFREHPSTLIKYGDLDDNDVWGAIKIWKAHRDPVLSILCNMILDRNLFRIKLSSSPISRALADLAKKKIRQHYGLLQKDASYLFAHGTVSNEAYVAEGQHIQVLLKNGNVIDLTSASDLPQIGAMSKAVKKNFLCWPKNVDLNSA
jgi:uncharacterized protein